MVCYGTFWSGEFCRRLFHCPYVIGVYASLAKLKVKLPGESSVPLPHFIFSFNHFVFFNFALFKDLDKGRGQHPAILNEQACKVKDS